MVRQRPKQAIIAATVILLVMAWGVIVFSFNGPGHFRLSVIPSLVFGVVLVAALSELFFPIHYRLTPTGAYRRNFLSATQIEWRHVRKCYLAPDGIKLSPLRRQTRLEAFRGVFLRFGNGNSEEVMAAVKRLRPQGKDE